MTTNNTVDNLNEQIVDLSPAKRALLELRLKKTRVHVSTGQDIPRSATRDSAPLSFAQQRLWFLNQLEPDNPSYTIPRAFHITGPLNVQALQQSLNEIVRRHESLRTSFLAVDGNPMQVIAKTGSVAMQIIDLSDLHEGEREAHARRLATEQAERPVDLAQGPLFRASLLRLDEHEQVLLLTMHHIVSDGWSMAVLFRELTALYEAFSAGKASPLPELAIQYADFAVWQREWLQGEELERQVSYWKQQLGAGLGVLELPTNRARPAVRSHRGGQQRIVLSNRLSQELRALSQREGVTLFMTMLAAFQALLGRYSGQEEISVGTPIANRNRAKIEDLIGFFINTLVLRTDMSGDLTFRELVGRVREVALGAYAHQDLPFEKLVEEMQPQRSLNRNPLFDVVFSLQNAPKTEVELCGVKMRPWAVGSGATRFDLEAHIWEGAEKLSCTFVYSTDLYDASRIERIMSHYEALLERVVASPDRRLSQLPLMKDAERKQLVVEWNKTTTDYPRQRCIHQLFETQAELTPDAIAVGFEEEQLTYRELNARANQLAHYLQKLRVGPEVMVGICVERSVEMVVGLLGILKAGGAYVPLDAAYPRERLSLMLDDAEVPVLLTQQRLLERLPAHSAKVVCLDADRNIISHESEENITSETAVENLAYVSYTSGSTGTPKGVSVTHRGVVRLVKETNYVSVNPDDVFMQFAPISFDASTFEIWGCLLNGARLVIFPPYLPSLEELGEALQAHNVTTLWLTAGLFHQMVESNLEGLKHIRQLLAGGDVLSATHVQKVLQQQGERRLINGYGPTENTTFTCCHPMTAASDVGITVPIGSPIANTQVYLLNHHLEPVAIGEPGELYIGGDGLARGYLNRPDLTADSFIPDPVGDQPGARLYKTGDLARHLEDGNIEFLGRTDNQIKIRGFRIELAEIESALAQHPSVRESVVIARQDTPGDKRLVAYFVPDQETPPTPDELRSFLKEKLPEYMIPSAFVQLSSLPLTSNGKVDRRALAPPDPSLALSRDDFIAPRNEFERVLTKIWERVLNVGPVSVKDNFFNRGGNSLLAVRLVSEIEKVYSKRIPLSRLFQRASVEGLAEILREEVGTYSWPTLIEIQAGDSMRPFFCVSAPNVNALGYVSLARHLGPDQPVYGLQSQCEEPIGDEYSQSVVEALATEYTKAMRGVQAEGPYLLGGMCRGAHIAFEMARQLDTEGQEVALLAILDTWVMENTYSYFWYLNHYIRRLRSLFQLSPAEHLAFAMEKARSLVRRIAETPFADINQSARRTNNHLRAIYWPGRDFVPQVYRGRVTLFRRHKQPYTRIRDAQLGWGKRAAEGVDVYFVPGEHQGLLQEPNVQVIAQVLGDCIRKADVGSLEQSLA